MFVTLWGKGTQFANNKQTFCELFYSQFAFLTLKAYLTMKKGEMVEILVNYYSDGNKAKFAAKLGVKPQTISTWISRDSFDVDLIYSKCEGIKAEWLLTGEGEMVNDPSITQSGDNSGASITGDVTINVQPTAEADLLKERVAALQDQIKEKQAIVEEKERLISEKQKLIDEKERTIRLLLSRTEQ